MTAMPRNLDVSAASDVDGIVDLAGSGKAVCIVRQNYYPDGGHVRRNAEALALAGYDVTVVAIRRDGQPPRELVNGVTVYRLPLPRRRGNALRYAWEYGAFIALTSVLLSWLHLRRPFRVVEVDNLPDVAVFAALVPKLMGARVIFTIMDNMPELLQITRGVGDRHPLVRLLAWLERASAAFADRVVVTQDMARELIARRGVPAEKIEVVLNGPDEAIFGPHTNERVLDRPSFEIVTHGTLLERFGIQTLIDALPEIARAVPDVRLRIVGEGEYRSVLQDRAERRGVAHLVEFHGWVPVDELPDQLRGADLGYVGMLCDNMLSNKLMEYVALGVPVLLARWPLYERYFHEQSVRYFRPGDVSDLAAAVVAAYRESEDSRARAQRATALYERYRWTVQRRIYLGVFAALSGNTSSKWKLLPVS
jgi:glycosyltransferase involved in cell wall biosynthesis